MLLYTVYILYSILIKYSTGAKISNSANFAPGILYSVHSTVYTVQCIHYLLYNKKICKGILANVRYFLRM